jgi:hypothetical protein
VGGVNMRRILHVLPHRRAQRDLEQRVADLELAVVEMRRHNLRLAELADVVQELVLPAASRDEERMQEAIAKFGKSL